MERNPELIIHKQKLLHNMQTLVNTAHAQGVQIALVSKVVCAHPSAIDCINRSGADMLADSRIENLEKSVSDLPKLMLRIGMPEAAEDIVRASDISLESEKGTILALEEAAAKLGKTHRVILMIDLGDLREGIFFRNRDEILDAAQAVKACPHLELYGTGTNLTCYGSVLPDRDNLGTLVSITEWLRAELGLPIPIISGGNSTSLQLLLDGTLPTGVNHLRLGESVMCGVIPGMYTAIEGCYQDVFQLDATIVECKEKPSYPIGTLSRNAFGETVEYVDKGIMRRAIAAIGRQDVRVDGLTPIDPDVEIIGASSDHLLLDLTKAKHYKVGDTVSFGLDYGALLSASTSAYVAKETVD
ncbi:MAG: alanine/ornithine racemase family PLP-dependent enzyme [Clostridia bacterium]|nr:alanine/ornithine racemase family PLP-dependent enzyme [Clostridia bacterium]